ncbi:hypothetical protein PUNSTDRAFT_121701 [Punctularia strigosozonata HHB-11173 SS5]|uniref:uncharacterized protein n=1 Tax=Punctularia strigosozonata (strain HHB-11173) TaxID=741275 RepID=UPI00044173E8|nr:uncharacterized protein PUNSTDRAFT_121701 [Punctularia strigosozonata HHB-11173 SS5]EIN06515.1 hypothetical protein PUNSTDRAFT_121701 [Punctularia strigosozonata HHB-11173 SS5]
MEFIHLHPITAANGSLWIGAPTSSLCPSPIPPEDCAPGTSTAFVGGQPALGLDVEVPGGQAVFVQSNGQLGFTQAHVPVIPDGATLTGFSWEAIESDEGLGQLSTSSFNATTFSACPRGDPYPYLVFARVPLLNFESCTNFDAVTVPVPGGGATAFEYI